MFRNNSTDAPENEIFVLMRASGSAAYEAFCRSLTARLATTEETLKDLAVVSLTDPSKAPLALRLQGRVEELKELLATAELFHKHIGV